MWVGNFIFMLRGGKKQAERDRSWCWYNI